MESKGLLCVFMLLVGSVYAKKIEFVTDSSSLLPSHEVCGVDTQDRIVGGETTELSEFPWMALLEYQLKSDASVKGFYCGGVLINPRYVLTAAHCIKAGDLAVSWDVISVRLGEHNIDTNPDCEKDNSTCAPTPVDVPVEEIISHESYSDKDVNQLHDIALVRLSRNVTYTKYVKPICLPFTAFDKSKNLIGSKPTAAGWGKTETEEFSKTKQKVNVPVKNINKCSNSYRLAKITLNTSTQLCAGGEKNKDSCTGDSGGPLMLYYVDPDREVNWYSIGIVSFGPSPCGLHNWPGIYTKVSSYSSWVISKLRA